MQETNFIKRITSAFDALDEGERPSFSSAEDRVWVWATQKKGRAEYYEEFNGLEEILQWIGTAVSHDRGGYLPGNIEAPLVAQSRAFDQRVLPELWSRITPEQYDTYIGRWNAGDFFFPNAYPVPKRFENINVLDFGAGYGRQLNLWSTVPNVVYAAMDIIRKPYLSQSLYFHRSGIPLHEYVLDPKGFSIADEHGIYHVPAWRWDLVPDNFFDLVLAIFVLPELNSTTLSRVLEHFARVLKPGGALFIRDHGLLVSRQTP